MSRANQCARRNVGPADAGVSAVIGAVLVFGLFSTAFIVWSFTTLPVWIADNEQARADEAQQAFTSLKNGLDLLAAEGSSGPITASFPLSADEVPLLQPVPSTGLLRYAEGFGWDATFTGAQSLMVDGIIDGTPTGTVPSTSDLDGVTQLDVLNLAYTESAPGSSITITATSATGSNSVTGVYALSGGGGSCTDGTLTFTVTSTFTNSPRVTTDCVAASLSGHRLDPMETSRGFSNQLNRFSGAFNVDVTHTNAGGSTFGAIWVDTSGITRAHGTTGIAGTVQRDVDSGRIVFDPINLHAIERETVWEGGSILHAQPDGVAVATSSNFDVRIAGTTGYLRWTVVELSGTGEIGGTGTADVILTLRGTDQQLLQTTDASIVIDSPYAAGWSKFLQAERLVAGATVNDFAIDDSTAGQVTLTLDTVDTVTSWYVHYQVLSAEAVVGA